jgi:hypothetical protein
MDRARDPGLAARLFGSRPEHTLALLRAAWPAAVGPDLARRTEVVAFDRGVLRVKVPDARWQRSLFRMRGDMLSRLRSVAGGAAPRSLGFVVGAVAEPPEPAPLPPAAAAIPDPEIRARFMDVAARYVERFRVDRARGETARGNSATG